MPFDYSLDFKQINFRDSPDLYRVGIGEQGVLLVEPYKSELLPLWRFRTPELAAKSARELTEAFHRYREELDFAGMDMARKFIQMGYTRSRRYANHRSGKKYDGPVPLAMKGRSGAHGRATLPQEVDAVKAESAKIFFAAWKDVEANVDYSEMKREWKLWYG